MLKRDAKTLVKTSEAARILGAARKTVQNWCDNGELEYVRISGNNRQRYIFFDSILKKMLLSGKKKTREYYRILNKLC